MASATYLTRGSALIVVRPHHLLLAVIRTNHLAQNGFGRTRRVAFEDPERAGNLWGVLLATRLGRLEQLAELRGVAILVGVELEGAFDELFGRTVVVLLVVVLNKRACKVNQLMSEGL